MRRLLGPASDFAALGGIILKHFKTLVNIAPSILAEIEQL